MSEHSTSEADVNAGKSDAGEIGDAVEQDEEVNSGEESSAEEDGSISDEEDEEDTNVLEDENLEEEVNLDEDAVVAEESTEEPYTPVSVDEIPAVFEGLESDDQEARNTALKKLNGIVYVQEGFVAENLEAMDLARIIKIARSTADETLHNSLLEVIAAFPGFSDGSRHALIPYIPDLMSLLGNGNGLDRYHILWILEQLAEEEPSSHDLILEGAKSLYHPVLSLDFESSDEVQLASICEAFETTLLFGREKCRSFFTRGYAFNAVLRCSKHPKASKVRLAAQGCLSKILECVADIDAELPDEADRGKISASTFAAFIDFTKDEDDQVAKQGAQFLSEDRGEDNKLVNDFITNNPDIILAVILQLGKKEPNVVGVPAEFALNRFLEVDELKQLVSDGFYTLWIREQIASEIKFKVISGLIDSFLDIRKIALEAGLCEFMLQEYQSDENTVEALTIFDRLMDSEQIVGSVALKTPGLVDKLLDLFAGSLSQIRCLSASNLNRILESYDFDSNPQRSTAAKILAAPNVLPRIIAGIHSDDPLTANSSAKLLAGIIADEDGTQSWAYDAASGKPPPPTPMKDVIVTEELARDVVGLLKNPQAAPGALHLLCQFCWGYQRGSDILRMAFKPVIPDADVFFFSALYGQFESQYAGRQKRVVADAVVQAGGISRVESLLNKDYQTVEERRAAVEGFRVLLCADSVDLSVGRNNARLPNALAQLFADEAVESMQTACYMIRLLSDESNPKVFDSWTDLATPETIQHFIYWLNKPLPTFEAPDEAAMTEEEFQKADREYDEKVAKANTAAAENLGLLAEVLGYLLPLLAPFTAQLIGPLLTATNKEDQNRNLLQLLTSLANNHTLLTTVVVPAVKDLLTTEPSPRLMECFGWIIQGTSLATAFYLGGILGRLEKEYGPGENGEIMVYRDRTALQIYEWLADKLPNEEHKRGVQQAFFAFKPALNQSLDMLRRADFIHDAFQSAGELYSLSEGYPEGIAFLGSENIFPRLLKLFDNLELSSPGTVAPLLGALCHLDVGALTKLLSSHINGLVPPPPTEDEALAGGKKGKKGGKGGKKKKFRPRISLGDVLDRCVSLAGTTPTARKALLDAGALDLANKAVGHKDEDRRTAGLKILHSFASAGEGYEETVAGFLPHIQTYLTSEWSPTLEIVRLARAFIPDAVQYLVQSGMHRALYKAFTDFPSSIGDMTFLIDTVRDLGNTDAGRGPLVEVVKYSFDDEGAFEQEHNWGNAHAARRLLHEGEGSLKLVVEAGAIDYAVRLLQADDLHLTAIGGALSATLARNEFVDARPRLLELGVATLIDEGYAKCVEESKKPFESEAEGDERENEQSAYESKQETNKTWIESLSISLKIINGEDVEDFSENYWL